MTIADHIKDEKPQYDININMNTSQVKKHYP